VLARIERKLAELQRWVDSAYGLADVPAAFALAMHRTRPASTPRLISIRPARLQGLAVCLDAAAMSDFVIYEEVFVDGIYDLSRVPFTPDVVIDCGAYHGFFSLLAAASFPGARCLAFEPNAGNFERLTHNVRHNGLAIDMRPSAVSTRDGSAMFSGGGCGGHLSDDATGGAAVPVVDLGRVITDLRSDALLLKLDIEGEERQLLPALIAAVPHRCAIFFEWHHDRDAYNSIAALLSANGFDVTVTRENRAQAGAVYIDAFAQR
jgi:FkbM family methyltransferase